MRDLFIRQDWRTNGVTEAWIFEKINLHYTESKCMVCCKFYNKANFTPLQYQVSRNVLLYRMRFLSAIGTVFGCSAGKDEEKEKCAAMIAIQSV